MAFDTSMLVNGDCVTKNLTFVTNDYRKKILPHIDKFKLLIEQGDGKTEIKVRDIRNMLGWEQYKDKDDEVIYIRMKDILLEFGIKVKLHHFFGANLIMTFADATEIVKEIDVVRKREQKCAQNAGFLNWNEYCKNKPSYRATRMTDMRRDEDNKFHFVYIGRKYIAQQLFPGAIINEKSLGGKYSSISGYDWTTSDGIKIKHIASRLQHRIEDDGYEREHFQWGIANNNVADIFLLTGWGNAVGLDLMKGWIIDADEIVNGKEFWDRTSFLISTHDRSIDKYCKFEVDGNILDKIRESLANREKFDVHPGIIEETDDFIMGIKEWYSTYFR